MSPYLLVALGGAAGSAARYAVQQSFNTSFPTGTLLVNLAGCFAIGILAALWKGSSEALSLFLITGFCGGFTTFSAFSLDGLNLIWAGRWTAFFMYASESVLGGLLATFLGYKLISQ